jgi:hypothetical protein
VVPIRTLKVSEERGTFFLPMTMAVVKTIPLMPDQAYTWLSDQAWRTRNDALFAPPVTWSPWRGALQRPRAA